MSEIQRLNIDHYNNMSHEYPLTLASYSQSDILTELDNYEVVVEKLEVPVNNITMPINNDITPFTIMIFNERKDTPELPYGVNTYSFSGPFYSIDDFLQKVNDIVQKGMSTLTTFGQFLLEDEMIYWVRDTSFDADYETYKIYFDPRLAKLLTFSYDTTDKIEIAELVGYRFNATANSGQRTIQKTKTFNLFFTLKAIRVYSSLPTIPYKIFNMAERSLVDSQLLTEVIYNSAQNYNEKNLIYIPTVFRHSSLHSTAALRAISFQFTYKYANGEEIPIMIAPFEYSSITIAFYPISKTKEIFI